MSYYTSHAMNVRGIRSIEEFSELQDAMRGHAQGIGEIIDYALDEGDYLGKGCAEFRCFDAAKWYDMDRDMINLSLMFPCMTFCVRGEGEYPDDLWNAYYHNGESEMCPAVITIPKPVRIQWDEPDAEKEDGKR